MFWRQSQIYGVAKVTTQEGDSWMRRQRRVATETGRPKRLEVVSIESESIDVLGCAVLVARRTLSSVRTFCFSDNGAPFMLSFVGGISGPCVTSLPKEFKDTPHVACVTTLRHPSRVNCLGMLCSKKTATLTQVIMTIESTHSLLCTTAATVVHCGRIQDGNETIDTTLTIWILPRRRDTFRTWTPHHREEDR